MSELAEQHEDPLDAATRPEIVRAETDRIIGAVLAEAQPLMRDLGLLSQLDGVRSMLLGGGKRMRALFCYWGCQGAGGARMQDELFTAAAALEINHTAFLIHDDIIDCSDMRRGQPSLHRRMASGSDAFGRATALTLGDLCFAWADNLISRCTAGRHLNAVTRIYHTMYAEAVLGQALELQIQADHDFLVDRCRKVTFYKAARYMLMPPLLIGATLADATEDVHRAYTVFGTALGAAYQLRDDLLGVFGDPATTGKPNLDDLREGKPTVLFAMALNQASKQSRRILLASYGRTDIDEDTAQELRVLLKETGAVDAVEQQINTLSAQAAQALTVAPVTETARYVLGQLADGALFRVQ
ncbi:polyprenyl synthetase family protein [Streptomyces sp. MNP-20]|uniref:polyprenyl synthetase family protein n=1 Tax=Streptomyces sp. MNP-20 TaxID=2721165 RepID=UPI001556AF12|nr:polyprenyl synthetase family protein [Streptomyces sp. MNP-20]